MVYERDGKYYWTDETQCDEYGPYDTWQDAQIELDRYCQTYLSTDQPKKEEWETLFVVRRVDEHRPDPNDFDADWSWGVINVHNGQTVGTYRDVRYARKQARRKYKKLMKLVDKSFTDIDEGK